jgi:hypothetical protein
MTLRFWKTAPFLLLLAGVVAAVACDTSDDDESCASVCDKTPDCAGTSCLAYCIATRDACNATSNDSAFSAWVSCQPTLICTGDQYVAATCDVEAIGLLACKGAAQPSAVGASNGSGSGIVFVTSGVGSGSGSAGHTVTVSSAESDEDGDGGVDAEVDGGDDCSSVGCVGENVCELVDGVPQCVPYDAGVDADTGF